MSDIARTKEQLIQQAVKKSILGEAICFTSDYAPYNGVLVSYFCTYGIVDIEKQTVELLPSYVSNMESAAVHIRNSDEIFKAGALSTVKQNDQQSTLESISA